MKSIIFRSLVVSKMNIIVIFLAVLGVVLATPINIDWSRIKPKHAFVEPISNISYEETGMTNTRIIGGSEVVPNFRTYQAALIIDSNLFCGGALVSSRSVLTAAHCVYRASHVLAILGAHNILDTEDNQFILTSYNVLLHEDYNPLTLLNDIALVITPIPFLMGQYIQVASLPPFDAGTFEGETGFFSGWGKTSESDSAEVSPVLNGIDLRIINNDQCALVYGSVIQPSVMCTSGTGGVGVCDGDSGSPLGYSYYLIGIASFISPRGCAAGSPSGFTRITYYREWILENRV